MKSCASIAESFVKADLSRESQSQSLPACLERQRRQGAGTYWICVIVTE